MSSTSGKAQNQGDHLLPLTEPDEIRLLWLAPCSANNRITCTTIHVRLSSKPRYEALSYEWGLKETKTISLNGEDYSIRTNLFNALSNLWLKGQPRILWVDAICINQDNVRERNHQVSQMRCIYS
ncbi:HET-domain-containing protein [Stipitochalara longipes BDJ]|nr:HET-domain-containing protein [Stipitochalara longipes BDJ]